LILISSTIERATRFWRRDPNWVEIASSVNAIGWGVIYFSADSNLDEFKSFELLNHIAPGWLWATYCLVGGTVQLLVAVHDNRFARWWCAGAMAIFPLLMVLSYLTSYIHTKILPPTAILPFTWSATNLLSVTRLLKRAV
jgi:hypothetical protein